MAERHLIVMQRYRAEDAADMPVAGVNNSHQDRTVVFAGVIGGSPLWVLRFHLHRLYVKTVTARGNCAFAALNNP